MHVRLVHPNGTRAPLPSVGALGGSCLGRRGFLHTAAGP